MKKNIVKCIFILAALFLVSCKSTKVEGEDAPVQEKNASEKSKESYIGWVDSTGKDVVYKDGFINLRIKQNLGTFNLGVVNDRGRVIPALSTSDEFTTSAFYLKTQKKTYLLRKDSNIQVFAAKKDSGVELNYSLDKVFNVNVHFEMIESGEFGAADMIKVTYTITNLGTKKDEFALKAIFDTILGESEKNHFYTSENLPVKSEVCYRTMQNQKWFVSRNKSAALQFILNGADTTAPELVALANYSTVGNNNWEPEMLSYRAFDTVLSYNNSAVEIIWPSIKVKPAESYTNVFYMAVASDGAEPAGHKYIFKEEPEETIEKVDLGKDKTTSVEPSTEEVKKETAPKAKEQKKAVEPEEVVEEKPVEVEESPVEPEPVEEETVNGLSKKQLTPEYIQNLIDRITELEKDTSKVNAEELLQLNAELDEILSALR